MHSMGRAVPFLPPPPRLDANGLPKTLSSPDSQYRKKATKSSLSESKGSVTATETRQLPSLSYFLGPAHLLGEGTSRETEPSSSRIVPKGGAAGMKEQEESWGSSMGTAPSHCVLTHSEPGAWDGKPIHCCDPTALFQSGVNPDLGEFVSPALFPGSLQSREGPSVPPWLAGSHYEGAVIVHQAGSAVASS